MKQEAQYGGIRKIYFKIVQTKQQKNNKWNNKQIIYIFMKNKQSKTQPTMKS